jgi:hypothetical protein
MILEASSKPLKFFDVTISPRKVFSVKAPALCTARVDIQGTKLR